MVRTRSAADIGRNHENSWIMQKNILSIQTSEQSYSLTLAWALIYYEIREVQTLEASSDAWRNYMIANFGKRRFGSSVWEGHDMGILEWVMHIKP
jgi:hypothetical protein